MRASPRNHGLTLWPLVTLLFAASLALAGWMVLAGRIDTTGLTEVSQWTAKHIAHDPHEFIRLCQNRINDTRNLADSAAARFVRRRAEFARAADDSQPQLRLAGQKLLELKAVYEWTQTTGRWPARYGDAQLDAQSLKAALIGTARFIQAIEGVSGQIPQALAAIDARLNEIQSIRADLLACGPAVRADLAARPPLPQEHIDSLYMLGERIERLRRSLDELAQPVDMHLPADVPATSFDEGEFARILANGR